MHFPIILVESYDINVLLIHNHYIFVLYLSTYLQLTDTKFYSLMFPHKDVSEIA